MAPFDAVGSVCVSEFTLLTSIADDPVLDGDAMAAIRKELAKSRLIWCGGVSMLCARAYIMLSRAKPNIVYEVK